jgi:hypothetical protein
MEFLDNVQGWFEPMSLVDSVYLGMAVVVVGIIARIHGKLCEIQATLLDIEDDLGSRTYDRLDNPDDLDGVLSKWPE